MSIELHRIRGALGLLLCIIAALVPIPAKAQQSVARVWNEQLLFAIRNDQARPTIHARNLFHVSIAQWDAWAAFEPEARNYLLPDKYTADDVEAARAEAMSIAVYRILRARFPASPGAANIFVVPHVVEAEVGVLADAESHAPAGGHGCHRFERIDFGLARAELLHHCKVAFFPGAALRLPISIVIS